jgi:hypothetical protein
MAFAGRWKQTLLLEAPLQSTSNPASAGPTISNQRRIHACNGHPKPDIVSFPKRRIGVGFVGELLHQSLRRRILKALKWGLRWQQTLQVLRQAQSRGLSGRP